MRLKIGEMIKKRGFTNKKVAKHLGVDQNTISRYCTGRRKIPLIVAKEIADFIGCSLDDFFDR